MILDLIVLSITCVLFVIFVLSFLKKIFSTVVGKLNMNVGIEYRNMLVHEVLSCLS